MSTLTWIFVAVVALVYFFAWCLCAISARSDQLTKRVVWQEGDRPEPVSPEDPLSGMEVVVLQNWLENSPDLRRRYQQSPTQRLDIENAARLAYFAAWSQALQLRASGLTLEEAQEHTRPALWTPPTWP